MGITKCGITLVSGVENVFPEHSIRGSYPVRQYTLDVDTKIVRVHEKLAPKQMGD